MEKDRKALRVIVSGGGTGGHIFPALAIADKLKEINPETEILFVGAEGRMEMEKVPAAGYRIIGLPVSGLQRKLSAANLSLPFKIIKSIRMAGKIIDSFRPDVAVGVGGYASAPLLWCAERKKVPTLIQEQNGFAGLANRILGRHASRICVAYDGMEKFFPAEKIVMTGNPIRKEIVPATPEMKEEAIRYYGLDPKKKHIFIVGGSLGSRTLNNAVMKWVSDGCPDGEDIEILWQCGKFYKESVGRFAEAAADKMKYVHHDDFIRRMDLAYAMADVVISRSGASSVSELCAAEKAVIFVPSPNVAEDHQTHNAMALVRKGAAMLVTDEEAGDRLMSAACALVKDETACRNMERNIAALARRDAASRIAGEIYDIAENSRKK